MLVVDQPRIRERWGPTGRRECRQDYYLVREASSDFSDYWAPRRDPDGVLRDRTADSERQQYLEDVADELKFIESVGCGAVLDYGSGPAWLLRALVGEWDKYAVEPCASVRDSLGGHGIAAYSSAHVLSDATFDVVLCYHVIEHCVDPIYTLSEIRRVMKPGGWLVLGTPDFDSPCAKRFGDNYRMLHDDTHCSLFSCESMHRFLRDHCFTIHDVRFPFPDRYATAANFARWSDTSKVSPPWPGNWMTFYCQR